MDDYNKIIESLGIRFIQTSNIKVLKPVKVEDFYDIENTIIILNRGKLVFGDDGESIGAGDILFIPGGKLTNLIFSEDGRTDLGKEDGSMKSTNYFEPFSEPFDTVEIDNYSYVSFEAKVFDSVSFFSSLDITPFAIRNKPDIVDLVRRISDEQNSQLSGRARVIKNYTDQIVIEVIRYILDNHLFVEQLATNSTYFKDPRLLSIFAYIRQNLNGDLTNKKLASVANVSEDYVGQYFKMLTGINPQDYIEYQRMELAVNLLRTSQSSIREIGREVGYKDTAYFCRRFKMMFGIPAGKMRRRESLMNV
ncbi:MAG: AraC family transcriptional regulator [Bacteroidota bacterium]